MSYPASMTNVPTVASGSTILSSTQNLTGAGVNDTQTALGLNPTRWLCELILTLTTGVPYPTSDAIGATTLYLTMATGNRIALFDGVDTWVVDVISSDISLALGTLTADTNYDVFAYDSSGTVVLTLGPAWTNSTTRSTPLQLQDGIWVNSADLTQRLIGSIRTTSTTTTEDSNANRLLFNAYNRLPRTLAVIDSTASWNYSTATWRQANGNTADQVSVLVGLEGPAIHLQADAVRSNTSAAVGATGIGINSTTALGSGVIATANANAASNNATSSARYDGYPQVGYSYYAWLEQGSGGGTDTWYGTSGNVVSGLSGFIS